MTWRVIGSVASGTLVSRSDGLTLTVTTGRTGSNAGLASRSCRYSSRIATNWPKCASLQFPRGPSPCSRISSMARCAEATSVTATSSGQPGGVLEVHALRALKEHEVAQRLLAERQQGQVHAGRVVAGGLREVRPGQVRGRAGGGQQVLHQRQVQHLLRADVEDVLAPALDRLRFGGGEALVGGLLQAERRVQVLAHDPVLELRRLAEHVEQRLAVLDDERGLGRSQAAPRGDDLGQAASCFFFNDTATTEIYTLSLHDALPIWGAITGDHLPLVPVAVVSAALYATLA